MKKEDFEKGQTVYIFLVGNMARGKKTTEERIQEWEVTSVGRKYISARSKIYKWYETKFEIDNNFRHVHTYGTADYILYLSKEDIFRDLREGELRKEIRKMCEFGGRLETLSIEQLEEIYKIMKEDEGNMNENLNN